MKIFYRSLIDGKIHFTEKTNEYLLLDFEQKYLMFCARTNDFKLFDKVCEFYEAFKKDTAKIYCFCVKDCVTNTFRECQFIERAEGSVLNNYDSLSPDIKEHDYYRFDFSEFIIEFERIKK